MLLRIMKIFLLFDIIRMNESKLISNPIKALNQDFYEIMLKILNNRVLKKVYIIFCTKTLF